jgi:hypothetical protein
MSFYQRRHEHETQEDMRGVGTVSIEPQNHEEFRIQARKIGASEDLLSISGVRRQIGRMR